MMLGLYQVHQRQGGAGLLAFLGLVAMFQRCVRLPLMHRDVKPANLRLDQAKLELV